MTELPRRKILASGIPLMAAPLLAARSRHMTEREFNINHYGADPSGVNPSDSAWQQAYAAAAASIQSGPHSTSAGALISIPPGIYQFSPNVVQVNDARIGLTGAGKGVTMLYTTGSSGSLVSATTGSSPNGPLSAPIGGFTLYGFAAGNSVNGLQIGDRPYMSLFDISADGFATAGSRGYYVLSTGSAGMEGVEVFGLDARNSRVGYCFDGAGVHGSFDYSRWNLHTLANGVALQLVNAAHCWGGEIILHGNSGTSLFADSVLVQIGSSSTDTAALHSCHLHIGVEADSGSSQIQDFVIQGQAGNSGIVNCYGTIALLNSTASWIAGSITGSRLSFYGPIYSCPLVAGMANSANTEYFFGSHIVAFDSAA